MEAGKIGRSGQPKLNFVTGIARDLLPRVARYYSRTRRGGTVKKLVEISSVCSFLGRLVPYHGSLESPWNGPRYGPTPAKLQGPGTPWQRQQRFVIENSAAFSTQFFFLGTLPTEYPASKLAVIIFHDSQYQTPNCT